MKLITQFKWFVKYFGLFKVPLIGYLNPKIIRLDDQQLVIKIKLNRRSKNHFNSMYFGALSIGADLAGGLYGFYYAKQLKKPISAIFKSFQASFLKRPEADVFFVCNMGQTIKEMVNECVQTEQRVTRMIEIAAFTHFNTPQAELVAQFKLELSLKTPNARR